MILYLVDDGEKYFRFFPTKKAAFDACAKIKDNASSIRVEKLEVPEPITKDVVISLLHREDFCRTSQTVAYYENGKLAGLST